MIENVKLFRGWVGNHPAAFVVDSGVRIITYEFEYYVMSFVTFPNGHVNFRMKDKGVKRFRD